MVKSGGSKHNFFFHSSTVQQHQVNRISSLKSKDGWITNKDQIKSHITNYFSSLFFNSGPRDFNKILEAVNPCVSAEMNASLDKPWLDEEIREAAFQLGELKAPGSDGFPKTFYFKNWSLIGDSVCKAVKSFFEGRFILKEINQTFIALIPKINKPSKLS